MNAVLSVDKGCEGNDDAIIAACCVIVEIDKGSSSDVGYIIFQLF